MCGIVGYIGNKQALPILLQGLHDLEYRGYDSAGVAVLENGKIRRLRSVGKISELAKKIKSQDLKGTVGIAHTRWATHGGVTEKNAHPHLAGAGKLVLVHNGIIENYRELKEMLKKDGVEFESETDSEVLAHLIAKYYNAPSPNPSHEGRGINKNSSPLRGEDKGGGDNALANAVRKALSEVRGTYGLLVVHSNHPDQIVAARLGSPLVIGLASGEHYVASDVTPMLPYTKKVTYLDDGEIAELGRIGLRIFNLQDEDIAKSFSEIDWDQKQAKKQGFEHFMLKEIHDQPVVFEDALRGRIDMKEGTAHLGGLAMSEEEMRKIERVVISACGTAYYAGLVGKAAFERLAGLPVEIDFSSEFRYKDPIIDKNTLVFAISQSGETADTLMALREAKRRGGMVRGIVNVVGSTIAREAGAGTYIHAGPELAVASTKAYTNMAAILLLYALEFGRLHRTTLATGQRLIQALLEIPKKMSKILGKADEIKKLAKKYKKYSNFFYLGRGINYPVALEGSLKLKEIAYIHSEAYPGGEMKHGPLALVDDKFPVVAICTQNQLYEKMKSNIEEAKARGGKIILVATEGDTEAAELADDVIYVPPTMELLEPLLNTIPLQLFAYYLALALKRDIDRPRNLAKSVTVE